jgi:3-(3-hydroxy-phenyl)propionate hydroxylase
MSKAHQPDSMPGYTLPVYAYRTPPELAGGAVAEPYPVIIAGGGLGGLATALELGSRGIRTVVLDEDDTVGAAGLSSRGICYAKRSLEILDRFGISARVRAKGITWNEGDIYRGEEHLYRFNLQPEAGQKFPAFVNLQQFYVEQYLVEKIGTIPAIDLRWKNRVIDVRPQAQHVELEVETPEGRYTTRCRYLVGADGAHSVVRDKTGARDAESALFEDYWCITDVRMSPSMEAVRKAYLDSPLNEGGAIWYHQMADGIWRTDWQIAHYPDPDAEATAERATERLKKLLPDTPFELVWVGPWRFRKRYLERMSYGRVFFLGDASAQHSPFGARGGNRAIQDANNLAWKLALVLEGRADERLLESYHEERHFAARQNVELSSRSAIFIGPETDGQRLFRDAILDLAQDHAWARNRVNTGRLSVATAYESSPLNGPSTGLQAPAAAPGAAAPDGRLGEGYFVEQLQGRPSVAWFGTALAPDLNPPTGLDVHVITVPRAGHEALFSRFGVQDTATYVFRPDGHVLARCAGLDPAFAQRALHALLQGTAPAAPVDSGAPVDSLVAHAAAGLSQLEQDRLYDALASALDDTPAESRERMLARLVIALSERVGDYTAALEAIREARTR